ncbi:MAG: hypothetical protein H8D74_02340 [Chloroflexi bacterium]|nr:hypothetical protein [Chloroflexota bacterium]
MKQFSELLERVKKLEEVVLELQQRMSTLEQSEAKRIYLSPGVQGATEDSGRAARGEA